MTNKDDDVLDLSKFISRPNEENGVWHEITIDNPNGNGTIKTGVEVKLYGPNSKMAAKTGDEFNKENEKINEITDSVEKQEKFEKALAKRYADMTIDIRAKGGRKLTVNGKEATKEDIYDIYYNAPSFLVDVGSFIRNQNNFIGNKE